MAGFRRYRIGGYAVTRLSNSLDRRNLDLLSRAKVGTCWKVSLYGDPSAG